MSSRFVIHETPLSGLTVIERTPLGDHRGYLERLFCAQELGALVRNKPIVQINHTLTEKRGTVRGMHFQHPPHAEAKFVSCLRGQVFDVAVDLRQGSSTLLRWHAEVLSADNFRTLVVPEGFAHGFQTLTDWCEMLYLHTSAYEPGAAGGIHAQDPAMAIQWPEAITELSGRDAAHRFLSAGFEGLAV